MAEGFHLPLEAVEMLATLAHGVWLARSKLTFKGKPTESKMVIGKAMSILHTYQKANSMVTDPVSRDEHPVNDSVVWQPLREREYKLNIDVAKAEELKWGIGAVIRNHKEEVLAAATWRIACGIEDRVVEGIRMQLGLQFARNLCFFSTSGGN